MEKFIKMDYKKWEKMFKPVLEDGEIIQYEADSEYIEAQNKYNVWTIIETIDNEVIILNDIHACNNLACIVTKKSWNKDAEYNIVNTPWNYELEEEIDPEEEKVIVNFTWKIRYIEDE